MRLNGKRILVPVDETPVSEAAFRWACQLARHSKAELHAIYVTEVPMEFSLSSEFVRYDNRGEEILSRLESVAEEEKCRVHAQLLQARYAGPAIALEAEDRQMELIILGVPYRHRMGSSSLGATPAYILEHVSCQVILWREPIPETSVSRG
jgi:nucleotide-binding universal stress UspA family protein